MKQVKIIKKLKKIKQLKRLAALLLAGVMIVSFTACNGNTNGLNSGQEGVHTDTDLQEQQQSGAGNALSEVKGSYVEKELVTPEGLKKLTNLTRTTDGSLVILDMEKGIRHISKDEGQSWEESEIPVLYELIKAKNSNMEILAHAVAKDGSMFIGFNNWNEGFVNGVYPTHYYYVDTEGNATEIKLTLEDYLSNAVFTENGTLYAQNSYGQVFLVDIKKQSAEFLFEPKSPLNQKMGVCGETMVLTDKVQSYFWNKEKAELEVGDTVLNAWVSKENEKETCIAVAGKEEKIYLVSSGGIYSHVLGGSVMEQIADGTLFLMGEPERRACALLAAEDGSFIVGYEDGIMCSYVYDENASAFPKEQLNVFSLEDNATVRAAIVAFRKKNPDVYVKLEVALNGTDSVTADDAIKNLNTRILAGEAPDILLLDGLPADSYIEKGMLLSIDDVLEETGQEEYFTNLFKAYEREEQTYGVPLRFQIPLLTGKAEDLEGLTDLKSFADRVEEIRRNNDKATTILASYTAEELLTELMVTNGNTLILENGEADKEALIAFFTQAKRIYQAEQTKLTQEDKQRHSRVMEMFGTTIEDMWKSLEDHTTGQLLRGENVLGMGNIANAEEFPRVIAVLKELENGTFIALPGDSRNVYIPSGIVGITSGSKKPELAKEFLKEMLSDTVQQKDTKDGLPVNKDAFEYWTRQENSAIDPDISVAFGDESGNFASVTYDIWPSDTQWSELYSIVEGLENPCLTDQTILSCIITTGERILTGDKSIEDGVDEIVQKINIYSKE